MTNVLIDTTIWSVALRRSIMDLAARERQVVMALRELIIEGQASLIGPIRQEILSGIRHPADFERLRAQLDGVIYLPLAIADYDLAASFFNLLQRKGVLGGPPRHCQVGLLICAAAARHDVPIFTTDTDFARYARHLPIKLHGPARH